jgi:hypothetical protein
MKIDVRLIFEEYERVFEISCGDGRAKTFKWLSNTVSQRFANANPNGALRHRDDYRGITENAQHLAKEIILEDGRSPKPDDFLSAGPEPFLRDGDEVTIRLVSSISIDASSGNPVLPKWVEESFNMKSHVLGDGEGKIDFYGSEELPSDVMIEIKASADFMRLILISQMLNTKLIGNMMKSHFQPAVKGMPLLKELHSYEIQNIFHEKWTTLIELFERYTTSDGLMNFQGFEKFATHTEMFPKRDAGALALRIHTRAVEITSGVDQFKANALNMTGFLVALLECAQLLHNDTYEKQGHLDGASAALNSILKHKVLPFAEQLGLQAVLKDAFSSDYVMNGIRQYHEKMFLVFEKYAIKSRELPTSLSAWNMAEMLFHAGLMKETDSAHASHLLDEVRAGHIVGRAPVEKPAVVEEESKLMPPVNGMPDQNAAADPQPDTEYLYPEFVEATAKAGFYRYFMKIPLGSTVTVDTKQQRRGSTETTYTVDSSGDPEFLVFVPAPPKKSDPKLSLKEAMVKGVELAVLTLSREMPASRK